jgi:cytosine/adenosine deaminase-related metal-dependent hydrolase
MSSLREARARALDRLVRDAPRRPPCLLLRGGYVLTMDPHLGDFVGDVLIRGDAIEAVGPQVDAQDSEDAIVLDVSGQIVLPGFVDSHVHAWEGVIRGIAPDVDLNAYMAIVHAGIAQHLTPDDVAIGQRVTAAQALADGVTTIIDNSHNSRTAAHSDAAITALRDSGIRAVHAVGAPVAGAAPQLPGDLLRLRDEYFSSADQLLTLRMFELTPTIESWTFAREHGLDLVVEMGGWIPDLDMLLTSGLVGPGHTYNHCAALSDGQWQLIADGGAQVNMVPRSDSQYGPGGFIPILQANRLGLQEGISCDNEVSYGYDIFTEMRTLLTVQRGLAFAAQMAGEADVPERYGPREALRAATVGGALNAGLSDQIGTLTPGKKADVVVLDLDRVPTKPFGSLAGTVVNFAGAGNVDLVLVDGIVRKASSRLVGTDYEAIAAEAERSREALLNAFGTSLDDVRFDHGVELKPETADQ